MRTTFVIGPPRSGTTLVLDLLRKHHDLVAEGESFHRFHHDLTSFRDRQTREDHFHFTTLDATPAVRTAYHDAVSALLMRHRRQHFVLKISTLSMQVDYVAALFSEARFVQLVRDARDVACSMEELRQRLEVQQGHPRALGPAPDPFGLWCAHQGYPGHLRALASWAFHATHSLVDLRFLGGERFLRVRYEDLVAHPIETVKAILDFMEVAPDAAVLKAAATIREAVGAEGGLGFSTTQSRSGKRVRRFEAELAPRWRQLAAPFLFQPMQLFGYEPDPCPTAAEQATLASELNLDLTSWWQRTTAEQQWFRAEWEAFLPERLLRQADAPSDGSHPRLVDGAVVGCQGLRVQGHAEEATSYVAKQARRFTFADPQCLWPQIARALNGEASVAELESCFALGSEGRAVLTRLHGLGFVAYV